MMKDKKLLFVYGTLMKGGRLHRYYMGNQVFIGNGETKGLLYTLNNSYPMAIHGEGIIKGEIYEVSQEIFNGIKNMEEGVGYKGEIMDITLENGENVQAVLYFIKREITKNYKKYPSGERWS